MSSSSSSSSSSSNSASSESGSSDSSDSDTSSTDVEKKQQKPQIVTRRSEAEKATANNITNLTSTKTRPTANNAALRRSSASVDEDNSPPKKVITAATIASSQRKKMTVSNTVLPSRTKAQQSTPTTKTFPMKRNSQGSAEKRELNVRPRADSDDSDREIAKNSRKQIREKPKEPASQSNSKQLPQRSLRAPLKRNPMPTIARSATGRTKSSESGSDSGSDSGSGSSDSSETDEEDGSDSSNSFMSQPTKTVKGKRPIAVQKPEESRKLTRSLSTRQNKQLKTSKNTSADATNSDTDIDECEKRSSSKSPAKKGNNNSKSKVKKEIGTGLNSSGSTITVQPPAISPPQLEKKCPIEGCDSSGHLSGILDKHFLPEACPIYHNMSVSECKERVNERKLRNEQRQKANRPTSPHSQDSLPHRLLSPEQREFLGKIKESRARFKPIATAICPEKLKVEKECIDEDREPCLNGIVPDYDLQLFREAQAIAAQNIEEEVKDLPVGKGIKYITMGKYKMKVWYQSPYPDDSARLPQMYICEFCLRYRKSEIGIKRHAQKCIWRHPPGDEIYRKGKLQVWQVDGKRYKQYCQHLCLLAKFFLDHKTLYYDVEPFLFYIMTLADVDGCHTVGYFSKEKNSFYNVSCILTLPPYQRKGYGRLLIDFSYLLTRVEGKIGSPEKPLSDLGLISYRSYWKDVLLDYLCNRSGNALSIKDVSQEMAIYSYDIVSTLQALGMMKYWKGKHIVLKKQDVLDEYEERVKRRGNFPKIDETCLRWSPFVPTQANNSH